MNFNVCTWFRTLCDDWKFETYPDGCTGKEWIDGGRVRIRVMMAVIVMTVMMVAVSGVRATTHRPLFCLDRHRHAGLAFPLSKPVPVHAVTLNKQTTLKPVHKNKNIQIFWIMKTINTLFWCIINRSIVLARALNVTRMQKR